MHNLINHLLYICFALDFFVIYFIGVYSKMTSYVFFLEIKINLDFVEKNHTKNEIFS